MSALKALVIGFGVLILAGFAIVAVTLVKRAGDVVGEPMEAAKEGGPAGFGDRRVEVPAGAIEEMVAEGDRLFLRMRVKGNGTRILVLDVNTGARLGAFDLEAAE